MNKPDLINKLAEKLGTKIEAEKALNSLTEIITDALLAGDKVTLQGIGTFEVTERAERPARNPHTGEIMKVPPHKAAKFKVSKVLKEALRV